jgi:nitroreductase
MNIIETIQKRHSVRTYTGEPLRSEHTAQITSYINQLQAPFGAKARIELIHANSGNEPVKLGTYGLIKAAPAYMAMVYEEAPFAETAAACMFERAVLFCTHLGLGTCWIGGTFSRSNFKKQIALQSNERLKAVSPVGYAAAGKPHFLASLLTGSKPKPRKPFEDIFFDGTFDRPLTEKAAGIFGKPLEMVRLAPSANNRQEWRVLLKDNCLHFYKQSYPMFENIDMGIAICHFELACKELGIAGRFETVSNMPDNGKMQYVISWTGKQQ